MSISSSNFNGANSTNGKWNAATIRAAKGGTFRLYVNGALSGNVTLEKGQSYSWSE